MRNTKTKKISEILQEVEETKRNEIIELMDTCLKSICCDNIDWKEIQVFMPSCETVKMMLESLTPEYLMTVCDKVNQKDDTHQNVKISVLKGQKETSIFTINQNIDTMLVYISISNKRLKEIEKRLQE